MWGLGSHLNFAFHLQQLTVVMLHNCDYTVHCVPPQKIHWRLRTAGLLYSVHYWGNVLILNMKVLGFRSDLLMHKSINITGNSLVQVSNGHLFLIYKGHQCLLSSSQHSFFTPIPSPPPPCALIQLSFVLLQSDSPLTAVPFCSPTVSLTASLSERLSR